MSQERYTTMTRRRYRELEQQIVDGTLQEKWKNNPTAATKADKVEERQIRTMMLIYTGCDAKDMELLSSDNWDELHVINDNGTYRLQIFKVNRKAMDLIRNFAQMNGRRP